MVKIKVVNGVEMCLFTIVAGKEDEKYSSLLELVETRYSLQSGSFLLHFVDDEGDKITLASEADFNMALEEQADSKSFKIFITENPEFQERKEYGFDDENMNHGSGSSTELFDQNENDILTAFGSFAASLLIKKRRHLLQEEGVDGINKLAAELFVQDGSDEDEEVDVSFIEDILKNKSLDAIVGHPAYRKLERVVFPKIASLACSYLPSLLTLNDNEIHACMHVIIPVLLKNTFIRSNFPPALKFLTNGLNDLDDVDTFPHLFAAIASTQNTPSDTDVIFPALD